MSYRIVAVFAAVAAAGLLSVAILPGTLAEIIVMLVTLGVLLNVTLTNNSLTKILVIHSWQCMPLLHERDHSRPHPSGNALEHHPQQPRAAFFGFRLDVREDTE